MTKGLVRANNFSDLADKGEAVVNLGLSAADYTALKGLYTTAGIDFAVIGEIGNSQGNYQAQLDGIATTLSGVVLSGYVNRSGDTILGTWTHSGIINISSGLPSGYLASTDSLFSLSIESGEAVIVASGLIASGLSYNGVRQSSSTVQRAFLPSGFSPLHLIPLQVGGQSFFAEAGESPSFYIDPVGQGHALDLVTGTLLGGGTVNCATPAWEVGPDGILYQPAANTPVIGYDPVTLRPVGLRVWGVVTNQVIASEDFSAWGRGGILAFDSGSLSNVILAPNGQQTADKVVESTISGNHLVGKPTTITATGQTVTVSIFAKKAERSIIYLQGGASTNWASGTPSAFFDLNAGISYSYSNVTAVGILAFPNGWYRCFVSATTAASGVLNPDFNVYLASSGTTLSYVGDGTSGLYLWGAQSNIGPLSPYVPTTTTTTTTASSTADVISITGADFTRIWNQSAGTMYAEGVRDAVPGGEFPVLMTARAAALTERAEISYLTESVAGYYLATSGVTQAEMYPSVSARTRRVAGAFAANDFAFSANGSTVLTDTSGAMPAVDRLFIGSTGSGQFLNGYIRRATIFRSRRPNANLHAMTS